jgi:hypothetical protein
MMEESAGGAGGLGKISPVKLPSGEPHLSRALVPLGMVIVNNPSGEVAVKSLRVTPVLSANKVPD